MVRFTEGFRLNGGACEVVLRDSVVLAGEARWSGLTEPTPRPTNRIFLVQSLVAGPGPIIDWTKKTAGRPTRSLVVRAFGSVFGRLHGSGIASVICFERLDPGGRQANRLVRRGKPVRGLERASSPAETIRP